VFLLAKRDYTDFISFSKSHKGLSKTELVKQFRKSGGKIADKKATEVLKETKYRGKKKKSHKQKTKRNNYVKLDKKKQTQHIDKNSPAVKKLMSSIEKMYGTTSDSYIQVQVIISGDEFTHTKKFSIFLPNNGKQNQGVKRLANDFLDSIETYYNNLEQKYGTDIEELGVLEDLQEARNTIKNTKGLTVENMREIMKQHGFEIGNIGLIEFTDNSKK
jgi:hypothetical protein